MKWKWTIPILAAVFLATMIGCGDDANAQLFRRNCQPQTARGGSGQFDFQTYMHIKLLVAISENRQRIEALEAANNNTRLQALRDTIHEEVQARIQNEIQNRIQAMQPATQVPPATTIQVPASYVPAYRQMPTYRQTRVQVVPQRTLIPRIVRRE